MMHLTIISQGQAPRYSAEHGILNINISRISAFLGQIVLKCYFQLLAFNIYEQVKFHAGPGPCSTDPARPVTAIDITELKVCTKISRHFLNNLLSVFYSFFPSTSDAQVVASTVLFALIYSFVKGCNS